MFPLSRVHFLINCLATGTTFVVSDEYIVHKIEDYAAIKGPFLYWYLIANSCSELDILSPEFGKSILLTWDDRIGLVPNI